jgi:hypothetical protein
VPCVRLLGTAALIALAFAGLAARAQRAVASGSWQLLIVLILGQLVTTLVAMSGCLRRGRERWLYVGLAVAAGLTIDSIGYAVTPAALGTAVLVAATLGFAALRAFGESLARYDPIS